METTAQEEKKTPTLLTGQADALTIANWKKSHGSIWALKVDGSVGYVRQPGRKELAHATAVGASNPIKFNETILRDCWLGGDMAIQEQDDKFLGVSGKLAEIIEVSQCEVEKL